jgi:phytoene synthase
MNELKAAKIFDDELRKSYLACKRLNSKHGKTYYLATLLLPPHKRPFVHALYGFARYADEIVDDLDSTLTPNEKAEWLNRWSNQILQDIRSEKSSDHIGRALIDTVKRFDIPIAHFEAFLNSMAMDLTVTEYQRYEDLMEYVYGSAAVIGLEMVPILGIAAKFQSDKKFRVAADEAAKKLGIAFQLANFIRDVGEDLERGRVYLPMQEWQKFGVTRKDLEQRIVTSEIREAMKFQIDRVRKLQIEAAEGIKYLSTDSQPCILAASELYCGIVDEVEKIDYQIFTKRAKTSSWRRLKVAFPAYIKAMANRN